MKKIVKQNTNNKKDKGLSQKNQNIILLGNASTLTLGAPGRFWEVINQQLRTRR
jgi:hypothetical protein